MQQKTKPLKDVRPLYKGFMQHLYKHRKRLAPLQILSRLEDYLTKEFAAFIINRSNATVLPLLNFGKKADGRRIDLALAMGDFSKGIDRRSLKKNPPTIRAFVELKYICNRHRFGFSSAGDEIGSTLRSLHEQVGHFEHSEFARYRVNLRSGKRDIYGVVFASYVHRKNEPLKTTAEEFTRGISNKAKRFQSFNFKNPNLKEVHRKVRVCMLGADYTASLYAGLWRRR